MFTKRHFQNPCPKFAPRHQVISETLYGAGETILRNLLCILFTEFIYLTTEATNIGSRVQSANKSRGLEGGCEVMRGDEIHDFNKGEQRGVEWRRFMR